jgi:hypothetical protein
MKRFAFQDNISEPAQDVQSRINQLLQLGDVLWFGGGGMKLDPHDQEWAEEEHEYVPENEVRGPASEPSSIRQRIIQIAENEVPPPPVKGESWASQDPSKYLSVLNPEDRQRYEGKKVYWCGMFALWVFQKAGLLTDVNWEPGKGFLFKLPTVEIPKPGDLGYMDKRNHHSIVKEVNPETGDVVTIDGNSMWGRVAINKRKLSDFRSFHSIAPLIGED